MFLTKKQFVALGIAGLIVGVVILIGLGLYFGHKSEPFTRVGYDRLAPHHYKGAVTTNGYECAEIGGKILEKGGSAVDSAIAALFCEGVAMPQSMGLGGGFLMTIYIKETRSVVTLDARESAPLEATENMFEGNASIAGKGGLSIAVPGELLGYWEAHKKYGKLAWMDVVQPTIDLCRKGHLVTKYLEGLFKRKKHDLLNSPSLREVYIDPATNDTYQEGHLLKRLKLAESLEIIARDGADALYRGKLTKPFVEDIQSMGGIISEEDLKTYKVLWQPPIVAHLPNNQMLYTSPLPGSGVILSFIFNILGGFLDLSSLQNVRNWQRIVESFKYGYGKRTELGDPRFVDIKELLNNLTSAKYAKEIREKITDNRTFDDPSHYGANVSQVEDHGTAHISVLAPNGDAVSATSTINQYFGADLRSVQTGIILNDEMDDFSSPNITNGFELPPSPANYIKPGKRPLSSMCPTIVVNDNGDVALVIGAAGGSKITTSVALVTVRQLWFNQTLPEAVDLPRLHHQLFPMHISVESDFDKKILNGLFDLGHNITIAESTGFAALTAISMKNNLIEASVDKRRGGQIYYIVK